MNDTEKEFEKFLYYGSNEWLLQFRSHIERYIEERKSYTHELFFVIEFADGQMEHKSIVYTSDPIAILKKEDRKILSLTDYSYKSYRVYLRRFEDNHTIMLALKKDKELLEVTLDYFKMLV